MAIGDVNGDGKPDLAIANGCSPLGPCQPGTINVLLGNGDGTFRPPVAYESGGYAPGGVAVADVNGDAKLDLVVANNCDLSTGGNCASDSTPGVVGVLLGNGDGTFQAPQVYGSGGYWISDYVAVADVDGDGKPDILVVDLIGQPNGQFYPHGSIGVLLNAPSGISTTTTVASSSGTSGYGQAVTFTGDVTSDSGTPTGTVQILNGSTLVGSGTLSGGVVSILVSTLPAGTDSITASYLGGGEFARSKSAPLTQTVTKAATATSLDLSLNPAATNQALTFTAAVSSQYGGTVTGTVTFIAGSQNLGNASLSGNVAALTTSFGSAGTYSITALYSGDSNNTGSGSPRLEREDHCIDYHHHHFLAESVRCRPGNHIYRYCSFLGGNSSEWRDDYVLQRNCTACRGSVECWYSHDNNICLACRRFHGYRSLSGGFHIRCQHVGWAPANGKCYD